MRVSRAVPTAAILGISLVAGGFVYQTGCSGREDSDIVEAASGYESRPPNRTCKAPARPQLGTGVKLAQVFPDLTFRAPVGFMQAPGDASRYFVVEQGGYVKEISANGVRNFIDITGRVRAGGEAGLLGVAFHPKWPEVPEVFLSYNTAGGPGGIRSTVTRLRSNDGGRTIDGASEKAVIPPFDQPYANHNGGSLGFGKDGFLYIGFGDGGSGGDPLKYGQNVNVPFGKILRIDVDSGSPYAIPADNPFANGGGLKEIYAWGIRNPWRFTFDRLNGELWLADVGQNKLEEIDRVLTPGNYGWSVREGNICYNASTCATAGFIEPVAVYGRSEGVSVTGGYVYRGTQIPGLVGAYIYGDYASGRMWALFGNGSGGYTPKVLLESTGANISSFGEDLAGEHYLVSYRAGKILKIVPDGASSSDTVPRKLSQTGCFNPSNPREVAEGVIPYGVNSPLWSDGAEKERYFAIPDGTHITVQADGHWDLPVNSVLVKTFYVAGKRVETRLLVRHEDGEWAGYTYEWNDAETDAELLPGAKTKEVGGQTWSFPSRAQCSTCHTEAAGRTLGLETAQLNGNFDYPTRRRANQIATLSHLGYFAAPVGSPEQLPALPDPQVAHPDVPGDLESRARSYLHANCANCHRPGGTGAGVMDFRFSVSTEDVRVIGHVPSQGDLGVEGAKLVTPGDPAKSVLSLRIHATNTGRMPPLGSSVVDTAGAAVIDGWIQSLEGSADNAPELQELPEAPAAK